MRISDWSSDVCSSDLATQKALGADVAILATEQLGGRYPWLNTADLAAGSLGLSGEGWLDAYGMMQGLRKKAIAQGAEYIQNEITGQQRQGSRITGATLDDGTPVQSGTQTGKA